MAERLLETVEAGKEEVRPGASLERGSAQGRAEVPEGRQTLRVGCQVVDYG